MSSAGFSGTSDTNRANIPGDDAKFDPYQTPEGAAMDEMLGDSEPAEVLEIVEIDSTDDGLDALGLEPGTGPRFRWWYVPAVALPVAAGATAGAIWLSRRNKNRRQLAGTYNRLTKQGRSWLQQVRSSRNTQQATKMLQQGIASARESAKGLPDQAGVLRDRSAEALAAIDLALLLEQTRGIWSNALDQVSSLWERNAPATKGRAKRVAKASGKAKASDMRRRRMAQQLALLTLWAQMRQRLTGKRRGDMSAVRASDMQTRLNRWLRRQQRQQGRTRARGRAAAGPLASAARSTSMTMQKTGKRVSQRFKRARAFSFGLLVTAMLTYIRAWRSRLKEREMRETAGGRLVRDSDRPIEAGALR